MVLGTGDGISAGQNKDAPTGALANSGWQFEGLWQSSFTGTPIAPNFFITSSHIFGNVGDPFILNGTTYTTTKFFDDPSGADLRIWQVSGTFPSYAPLYTESDETGRPLIAFGRGGPKGAEVTNASSAAVGWLWGAASTTLSWGTNVVAATGTAPSLTGNFVIFGFNNPNFPGAPAATDNTAALTSGDSGAGLFVLKNGVWRLAGVNSAADGPYTTVSTTDPTQSFAASLYDSRGFFFLGDKNPIPDHGSPVPSQSYATQISTELAWISSVTGIAVPEPSSYLLLAGGMGIAAPLWMLRRRSA
jgi:hypothetical protein